MKYGSSTSLAAIVQEITDYYFERIEATGSLPMLKAFVLVGSAVSIDDFVTGSSDIDFVAVLAAAPTDEQIKTFAEIHQDIAAKYTTDFDGIYFLGAESLDYARRHERTLGAVKGKVKKVDISNMYASCLEQAKTLGVVLYGTLPSYYFDKMTLAKEQEVYVNHYTKQWQDTHKLPTKGGLKLLYASQLTAWCIYDVARSLYLLRLGKFMTKREMAILLLKDFPEHSYIINQAINARTNRTKVHISYKRYKATLDFQAHFIHLFNQEYKQML